MASTKIRGITIELGGDASGLKSALKDVSSEIKNTQTQLKDVEKLLKLDPGNTELLEQKQKLLNDRVDETKQKLETLKKTQEELKNAGVDELSNQYMAVSREIIETKQSLEDATEQAEKFNVAGEKISSSFDKVSSAAQNVSNKTKKLSEIGSNVAGSMLDMAKNAMTASDDLNTLAKQSGFTTEELQRIEYASDLIDVSTDTIVSAIKKMRNNMDSTSSDVVGTWEALGVAVTDAEGNMRDSTDVFYEAVEALSQVENETLRDQYAMNLFGKSADDLAGIIDDGGAALREYGDEADVWSQESIDAANAVNDQVDEMKAHLEQTLLTTGAKILEELAPFIEIVIDKISEVLDWVGSLDGDTLAMIGTVAGVIAAISPVAGIISSITGAMSTVSSAIPGLGKLISGLTSPVGIIVAAVAAAVGLILKYHDQILGAFDKVDEKLHKTFEKDWTESMGSAGEIMNAFSKNILNIWDDIKGILTGIVDFVKNIFAGKWKDAWENVVAVFKACFGLLKDIAKAPLNAVIGLINSMIDGINKVIKKFNDSKLSQLIDKFTKWSGDIPTISKIPLLANGGVLSSGSAIVGEAGAELLTMQNGKAVVQPLTNNNTYNTYNQTATSPIMVELSLDGSVLARQLVSPLNRAQALAGGSVLR